MTNGLTVVEPRVGNDGMFPVSLYKVQVGDAVSDRHVAVTREDTGEILAVHSNRYELIPNAAAVDFFTGALKAVDLPYEDVSSYSVDGGRKFFQTYRLPQKWSGTVDKGDVVASQIQMFNSYDGSMPWGCELAFLRLVCTNGMVRGVTAEKIRVRHIGNWDTRAIGERVQNMIMQAESVYATMRELKELPAEAESIKALFESEIPRRLVAEVASEPEFVEHFNVSGDTDSRGLYIPETLEVEIKKATHLWFLYNLFTSYITHRMQREYHKKVDYLRSVGNAFGL